MIYHVLSIELKKPDWKIATLKEGIEGGKTIEKVSINKTDQKGDTAWATFDDIKEGSTIEGNYWENAKGLAYLFPPKPKTTSTGAPRGNSGAIAKAQEKKAEDIATAQTRKHEAIATAGAFRDATLIALASLKDQPFPTDDEFKAEWLKWVKWILVQNEQPFL